MKAFGKFLLITLIGFAVFMATGFLCNWMVQGWSHFVADCNLICRIGQLSATVDKFNAENPVVTFGCGALMLAMILALLWVADDKKSAEIDEFLNQYSDEKPKNKEVARLGDDGEWIHPENPTPSGYLLPTFIERKNDILKSIDVLERTDWYPNRDELLIHYREQLKQWSEKIDALTNAEDKAGQS